MAPAGLFASNRIRGVTLLLILARSRNQIFGGMFEPSGCSALGSGPEQCLAAVVEGEHGRNDANGGNKKAEGAQRAVGRRHVHLVDGRKENVRIVFCILLNIHSLDEHARIPVSLAAQRNVAEAGTRRSRVLARSAFEAGGVGEVSVDAHSGPVVGGNVDGFGLWQTPVKLRLRNASQQQPSPFADRTSSGSPPGSWERVSP